MTYNPLFPPPPSRSLGLAIAAGAAVAVASAFVVGLIGGATNTQFAYGAVLIGFLAGLVMRKIRADAQTAIAGAVVALVGSALSSVIALTLHVVKVGQIPLSFVLGHESTVISDVPHYIGFFGFLCWALAAYVGWATAAGRRRRGFGRMRRAPAAGQAPPYGAARARRHHTVPPRARLRMAPVQSRTRASRAGAQPTPRSGYPHPGFATPPGQASGTGTDQPPGT